MWIHHKSHYGINGTTSIIPVGVSRTLIFTSSSIASHYCYVELEALAAASCDPRKGAVLISKFIEYFIVLYITGENIPITPMLFPFDRTNKKNSPE